jgi:hypothetical protein
MRSNLQHVRMGQCSMLLDQFIRISVQEWLEVL